MKTKNNTTDMLFVLGLFVTMFIAMVSIVIIGANVYSKVAKTMDDNFSLTTAVSYIAEKARQNDEDALMHIGEIENQSALVLVDNNMYTYIYYYDGYIREILATKDLQFPLFSGQKIVVASDLKLEQKDNSFIITVYNEDNFEEIVITPISEKENNYE